MSYVSKLKRLLYIYMYIFKNASVQTGRALLKWTPTNSSPSSQVCVSECVRVCVCVCVRACMCIYVFIDHFIFVCKYIKREEESDKE